MNKAKTTKEERLLLAIATAAKKNNSPSVDVKELTASLGYSDKQARQTLHLLTRANFLKKHGEWEFELTPHGTLAADQVE